MVFGFWTSKGSCFLLCVALVFACNCSAKKNSGDEIQPYHDNPSYWQYKGKPVLLIGGSKDDNLFQIDSLQEHLDLMKEVGANYIRNTMSSRDSGNVQPFAKINETEYNLDQWNEAYWQRFENMLSLTAEREIFVQIEIWAFHDFYGEWEEFLPWNPKYNVNYTTENTQLKSGSYGDYWETIHDFFYTVPNLHNDTKVLQYQQAFVDKILSHTFKYDHVLYCMTNEIFSQYSSEWGWYWARYIKEQAKSAYRKVQVAEMYQYHNVMHQQHRASFDHPEIFDFVDISQNSRQSDDQHWNRLQWVRKYLGSQPRPINHTKTYGGVTEWTDGAEHRIERFWRNIIGGAASARFHRPPSGIGLFENAQAQIKSARLILDQFNLFESQPDVGHSLISGRDPDEAYLTFIEDQHYVLYFPSDGEIQLDLSQASGEFQMLWLDIQKTKWLIPESIMAGKQVSLKTPEENKSWVAIIKK